MESSLVIYRHGAPNKYDQWQRGTRCILITVDNEKEEYIQQSNDKDHPIWIKVS